MVAASNLITAKHRLGRWDLGFYETAPAPSPGNGVSRFMLLLAEKRTNRPDILRGFRRYRGGWDIASRHYWASVGFTGVACFILALVWFISYGLVFLPLFCCGRKGVIEGNGSKWRGTIYFILIGIFISVAVIGSAFLFFGEGHFHDEALHTLKYAVNQSEYTVQIVRNVTDYLSLAKTVNIAKIFLPSSVRDDIDQINKYLEATSYNLEERTNQIYGMIRKGFIVVKSTLITVAVVVFTLSMVGLLSSYLGQVHAIHIVILFGWILVAITLIICAVFIGLNNAILDASVAMEEWAENPAAYTNLEKMLACVDQRTTNHTLIESKRVITNMVTIVNQVIYTVANSDPPHTSPTFYNQSGPILPPLCFPYDSHMNDQPCGALDVDFSNASLVWRSHVCVTSSSSSSGWCVGEGRLTSNMYGELVGAVNISAALRRYAPLLLSLEDCNFVRDVFREITSAYFPQLERHLKSVTLGLGLVSAGMMMYLVFSIICIRVYCNKERDCEPCN